MHRRSLVPTFRRFSPCQVHRLSSSLSTVSNWEAYCANLLRERDYESFLIGHCYPKEFHLGYLAIKAFSVELATVQDTVSNPMLGNMKMQFWRDAVKAVADTPPQHPIANAISCASQIYNLPSYHLKRIIDARDSEITSPIYLTVDSLVKHAQATSSSVLYLLLSMMDISSSELDHAASHLGVAQTIVTLLRSLPFHIQERRMVIPSDITAECGVVQEDIIRYGSEAKGLDDAVFKFATLANDHLMTAKTRYMEAGKEAKRQSLPVFMSMIPVSSFLRRLEKGNFQVYSRQVQGKDNWLALRILTAYYRNDVR